MPVLDGLETTRIVRLNSHWDQLPIIAMTAHAMNGDRERCLQAGMNSYVSKPIQPAHLLSIIEKQLQEQTLMTPPPQGPVADHGASARSLLDDSTMANDLLEVFLQLAPERLDRLEAAAAQADGTTLVSESRKIFEAAEQLASHALSQCAQRLELAARGRDFAAALQEIQTLRREIAELQALTA
jgi:CheY-like chemotaxis protein